MGTTGAIVTIGAVRSAAYAFRPYSGTPGTVEELKALRSQAAYLAERLVTLNRQLGSPPPAEQH